MLKYAEAPLPLGAVQDGEVTEPDGVVPALRQMWAQAKFSTATWSSGSATSACWCAASTCRGCP